MTLGTGARSNIIWEGIEVLASHSYAVTGSSCCPTALGIYIYTSLLDVDENEDIRTLSVLDTWVKPGQQSQTKQPSELLAHNVFHL